MIVAESNININSVLEVQIPNELAEFALTETEICGRYTTVRKKGNRTHSTMRHLGFYLLLKAECPESGWILNYTKQIPTLSQKFGISPRSFFSYLKALEELKIASRQDNKIRIVGWDQLAKVLDINTSKRTTIQFKCDGTQKIHWWFAALEIQGNQERQAYMIWKKVNKNSEAKNLLLTAMMKRGFDIAKVDNPEYFSGRLFMLYVEDFRTGTEVHDILIRIRADVNRGVRRLANDWGISEQLTSYWKKQMRSQNIISIAKLNVVSQWTMDTNECHKNPFCHVIWNDKIKERVWFLCDQISVMMPWKWQEFLENLEAA